METNTEKTEAPNIVVEPVQPNSAAKAPENIEIADWEKVKATDTTQTNTADPVADEFKAAQNDTQKTIDKPKGKTPLSEYQGVAYSAHWCVDEVYATVTQAFRLGDVEIDHKGGLQVNNKEKFDNMVKSLAELLFIEQIEIPALLKWIFYGGGVLLSYRELWSLQGKEIEAAKNKTKEPEKAKAPEGWSEVTTQNTK